MNTLLSLTNDEIEVLQDHHAEKIGHCDDAECDMHMKRIDQLERAKQSGHQYHPFEAAA